jgi:methylphosphotriester-DNA--protein-cysteine methyltransferase
MRPSHTYNGVTYSVIRQGLTYNGRSLVTLVPTSQLLVSEDLNLSEITKEVGYVDVSNFIRKFKKMEGVTPEQYRKLREKS